MPDKNNNRTIYLFVFCALYVELGETSLSFEEYQIEVFCLIDLKLSPGA